MAVIIVVRHGARLDQADGQWYLTTPTPYDPPLTYGGWTQSRALGARIANILRTRETDDEVPPAAGDPPSGNSRKRRHKVIIHSSPFLRCVQTSVAISAGLAQNPGHTRVARPTSPQSYTKPTHMLSSPRVRPIVSTESPRLAPVFEGTSDDAVNKVSGQGANIKKATIRVDAFLGEWLAPEYFEAITPPPSSVMMVAGAKADLLRREDYNSLIHVRDFSGSSGFQPFPGGWGSPESTDKHDFLSLSSLSHALPRRDRTSSLSSVGSNGSRQSLKNDNHLPSGEHGVYQPPVPSYAISSSDPIPPGYVAHARDACVDVDYQWDSMREPLSWGNGGEYGEEWPAMHKRFRKGLQSMLGWYNSEEDPGKMATKTAATPESELDYAVDEVGDEDTDLVLVLVTHGAGCNALIGALTNQPLLMDVGMASLTMAVRKPTAVNAPTPTPGATPKSHSRSSSKNISLADEYDLKLTANTDHLRSNTNSASSSRSPSVTSTFRERHEPVRASLNMTSVSSSLGSMRRTATFTGSKPRNFTPTRQSSIGLWSATPPTREEVDEAEETDGDSMILNFGDDGTKSVSKDEKGTKKPSGSEKDDDEVTPLAPLGLWGSSPKPVATPPESEKSREFAPTPKRRWTVNERG
ncbi:phosphoglycerate mutase protein [Rutstroemia sp. NJR-2017a BVV2]|nr:phosphoglycerate mutase protein [Rutstroemia sp. NJR-2017a BVV2]